MTEYKHVRYTMHTYPDQYPDLRKSLAGDKDCPVITKILAMVSSRPINDDLPAKLFLDVHRVLEQEKAHLEALADLDPLQYAKLRGVFQSNLWCRLELLEPYLRKDGSNNKQGNWIADLRRQIFDGSKPVKLPIEATSAQHDPVQIIDYANIQRVADELLDGKLLSANFFRTPIASLEFKIESGTRGWIENERKYVNEVIDLLTEAGPYALQHSRGMYPSRNEHIEELYQRLMLLEKSNHCCGQDEDWVTPCFDRLDVLLMQENQRQRALAQSREWELTTSEPFEFKYVGGSGYPYPGVGYCICSIKY